MTTGSNNSNSSFDDVKKRILTRSNLTTLIGETVKLTTRSGRAIGLCPFHEEKTPSFNIYNDHYYCFGCKASGDAIDFIRKTSGIGFIEALKSLSQKFGVEAPELEESDFRKKQRGEEAQLGRIMLSAQEFFVSQLRSPRGAAARAYLEKRGFTAEQIESFGFGLTPEEPWGLSKELRRIGCNDDDVKACSLASTSEKTGRLYDFFRDNRVMIPIRDAQGRIIAFGGRTLSDHPAKYINSRESRLFDKSAVLFGFDRARVAMREKHRAILVEGYMDVLQLWAKGFPEAVACMGTALSARHLQLLRQATGQVILLFDGDSAGRNASLSSVQNTLEVPEVRVVVATLPIGEDPDTFVNSSSASAGPAGLEVLISSARDLIDYAISSKLSGVGSATIPDLVSRDFLPWLSRISDRVQQSFLIGRVSQLSGISPVHLDRELRSLRLHGQGSTNQTQLTGAGKSLTDRTSGETPRPQTQPLSHLEAEIIGHLFFARPGDLKLDVITPFVRKELNLDPVWGDLVELLLKLLENGETPSEADLSAHSAAQSAEARKAFEKLREKAGAYTCDHRADLVAKIIAAYQRKSLQTTITAMKTQVNALSRDVSSPDALLGVREILQEISVLNKKLLDLETKLSSSS